MIQIAHVREIENLDLPQQAVDVIRGVATILDIEYGEDRNVEGGDGGYIVIVEDTSDLKRISKKLHIDVEEDAIPEYVDIIKCKTDQIYTSTLILCSNDFGVLIIMPLSITPDNLKQYIID